MAQVEDENNLGTYEARENLRELGSTSGTGTIQTFDNRYKGVKGTPFAFEKWYEGEIFMKAKKRVKFPNLNYNVFDNIIAYKEMESNAIFEVNRGLVDFFIIYGPDTMRFEPLEIERKQESIFAEILHKGKVRLYMAYEKEFLKANYEGGYSADREFDEFVDKVSYYVRFEGSDEAIKLRTSRRMSKQFPDHNKEMRNYLSNFSGRELNEKGILLKVIEHYDSLN